ncbi:flagellar hook-length control protein FliK [Aurantimonas sp. MSK8Z-1]|uniref:flagellar hook-length control protein FliK n=1 Tax=Mangrovibrevibacter kandeliae TaxID=2968473 RepID=UPI0021192F2C|nr:flagellar hook-length control protein FliK [Aurantimonas sp. MSK8Z-1]MCW4113711.1 flagellar hook-length control protein FliK [Aurantimonas sp. MSK8Z-1]
MNVAVGAAAPGLDAAEPVDARSAKHNRQAISHAFDSAYGDTLREAGELKSKRQKPGEGHADDTASEGTQSKSFRHRLAQLIDHAQSSPADQKEETPATDTASAGVVVPMAAVSLDAAAAAAAEQAKQLGAAQGASAGEVEPSGAMPLPSEALDDLAIPADRLARLMQNAEPDAQSAARLRVDVVRMTTHFEPTADQAVVLENAGSNRRDALGDPTSAVSDPETNAMQKVLASLSRDGVAGRGSKDALPAGNAKATGSIAGATGAETPGVDGPVQNAAGKDAGSNDGERSRGERFQRPLDGGPSGTERLAAGDKLKSATAGDVPDPAPQPGAVTGQVAGKIIAALGDAAPSQQPQQTQAGSNFTLRAGGAALKTMTIQLQPENLGTVDVSMRLVDGNLTVELSASVAETASKLAADKEGLRKLLSHAGFHLDDAAVTVVARDASQMRTAASTASDGGGQTQSGSNGGGDPQFSSHPESSQGRSSGQSRQQSPQSASRTADDRSTPSGSVFL